MYEYKIITTKAKTGIFKNQPADEDQKTLNILGSAGWELISVNPIGGTSIKSYGGSTVGFVYHLKRLTAQK